MASHRQWMVEVPVSVRGMGSSDRKSLITCFPASPFYNGEYTDEGMRELGIELLQSAIVNDGGHTFGEFNRDYVDAPNMEEVVTGGGGLPGSPWAPNIASPLVAFDPTTIPEEGSIVTNEARGGGGWGIGDGLDSPSDAAKVVSQQTLKIGSLKMGTSAPNGG